jgi:hypothetical protein
MKQQPARPIRPSAHGYATCVGDGSVSSPRVACPQAVTDTPANCTRTTQSHWRRTRIPHVCMRVMSRRTGSCGMCVRRGTTTARRKTKIVLCNSQGGSWSLSSGCTRRYCASITRHQIAASQTVSHSTASAPSACHTAFASPMQAAGLIDRVRCVCAGIQRAGASDAVGVAGVNIDRTVGQSDTCAYVRNTGSAAARM